MQNYIREKYRHLFDGMETLDGEYYYKLLSQKNYKDVEKKLFEKPNADVIYDNICYSDNRTIKGEKDYTFEAMWRIAILPESVVLLIKLNRYGKGNIHLLIALPMQENLKNKYAKAYLKRSIPVHSGDGEIYELYPVLLKADTLTKEGFIPLFDAEQEQSFERLLPKMTVWYGDIEDETVIQELYERRNLHTFATYERTNLIFRKYFDAGGFFQKSVKEIISKVDEEN